MLSQRDRHLWTKHLSRSICLSPFSGPLSPCPSIWIPLGWRGGEGRGGLVSSLPSHCSPGGSGLVCDLVSHMIETHLILLGINILQWNRGDSRREERGEDEREDGRGERGIFKKLYLPLFAVPHIGFECAYMCVFVFLCLCTLMGSSRLLPAYLTDSSQGVFPSLSFCICSISAP